MQENILITLQILLLHIAPVILVQPEIIDSPSSIRVGLDHAPVMLTCHVRGENIFWRINGVLFDYSTSGDFRARGITASSSDYNGHEITEILTVTITNTNNNTNIICYATAVNFNAASSNITNIFIADVPLPPSPVFMGIDGSTIEVEWEEPFTWEDFPILSYRLEVINETSMMMLDTADLTEDIFSYNLTRISPLSCTNLTFHVSANNSVGYSNVGITYGAFPDIPGEFLDSPRTEVTYSKDLSPILEISFTFPSLCPYHNATYLVLIEDENGVAIHTVGPHIRHWSQSGSMVTMEIREGGLAIDTQYTANITVTTLVGMESITVPFNTCTIECFSTTVPPPSTTTTLTFTTAIIASPAITRNVVELVSASLGTLVLMFLVGGIIVTGIYIYRRSVKRKRDCHNTTELSNRPPMVNNPIYEGMAIYEEIPDLKSLSIAKYTHEKEEGYVSISSTGSVFNRDFPTLENPIHEGVTGGQEETYTKMDSVGTLMGQLRDGAAANTERAPNLVMAYLNARQEDGASAKGALSVQEEDERYVKLK